MRRCWNWLTYREQNSTHRREIKECERRSIPPDCRTPQPVRPKPTRREGAPVVLDNLHFHRELVPKRRCTSSPSNHEEANQRSIKGQSAPNKLAKRTKLMVICGVRDLRVHRRPAFLGEGKTPDRSTNGAPTLHFKATKVPLATFLVLADQSALEFAFLWENQSNGRTVLPVLIRRARSLSRSDVRPPRAEARFGES